MNNNAASRSDVQEEQSGTERSSLQNTQEIKRTKRKKASRACFHCQKAHLTCDDSRPCQRCIKRGLAISCQDGVRKKAKYLQDIDDEKKNLEMARAGSPKTVEHRSVSSPVSSRQNALGSTDRARTTLDNNIHLASVSRPTKTKHGSQDNGFGVMGDNLLFDYPMLSSYDFDSKAANMEYSMISNMLGSVTTPGTDYGLSPDTGTFTSPGINNLHRSMPSRQHTITPDQASIASESSWSQMPMASAPTKKHPTIPSPQNLTNAQNLKVSNLTSSSTVDDLVPRTTSPGVASVPPVVPSSGRQNGQYVDPHGQRPTPVARRPHAALREGQESIYKAIAKPFSYTNGYHLLNTYLRARFEKEDLLRIARAIVGYRPSFIALTKTLKEEDLTFMEVCFQRTLLEYEKFVGYSGTPTIIWRRTGQIELVGKEFCLLTQWSREQLLSKQTFIVELMDDSSVVEYFEKFSAHAFGDTSSVQTTCVLMTPQKRAVPCAFCFTIKRDVFDIPMMIVGNFLPVL